MKQERDIALTNNEVSLINQPSESEAKKICHTVVRIQWNMWVLFLAQCMVHHKTLINVYFPPFPPLSSISLPCQGIMVSHKLIYFKALSPDNNFSFCFISWGLQEREMLKKWISSKWNSCIPSPKEGQQCPLQRWF